jgi:hypothetical protein
VVVGIVDADGVGGGVRSRLGDGVSSGLGEGESSGVGVAAGVGESSGLGVAADEGSGAGVGLAAVVARPVAPAAAAGQPAPGSDTIRATPSNVAVNERR